MATLPRINFTHTGAFCENLDMSAEEINARTEAMCRRRPGFQTRAEWVQSTADRIAQQRVRW